MRAIVTRLLPFVQRAFNSAGIIFLAWCAWRAVADPLLCWDPWMYHIPFAMMLWNMNGVDRATIYPDAITRESFGMVGEWFQGAFWLIFGSPNAISLVNVVPFFVLLYLAWHWLRISWLFVALAALSMPMIAIHLTSGYIDLMVGSLIALCVVSALRLVACHAQGWRASLPALVCLCICAAIAGNAKFTAVLPLGAVIGLTILKIGLADWRARRGAMVLVLCAAMLGATGNMMKNAVTFGNPVYPFYLRITDDIILPGIRHEQAHEPPYYLKHLPAAKSLYFLMSVTELDWWINPLPNVFYSEASQMADYRRDGLRSGGLFGPLVGGLLLIALVGTVAQRRHEGRRLAYHLWQYLGVLTLAYMVNPDAYELRYSLAWPLALCLLAGAAIVPLMRKPAGWLVVIASMGCILVSIQQWVPMQRSLFSLKVESYYPEDVRKRLNPAYIDYIEKNGGACMNHEQTIYPYDGFGGCSVSMLAYATPISGIKGKVEFNFCTYPRP